MRADKLACQMLTPEAAPRRYSSMASQSPAEENGRFASRVYADKADVSDESVSAEVFAEGCAGEAAAVLPPTSSSSSAALARQNRLRRTIPTGRNALPLTLEDRCRQEPGRAVCSVPRQSVAEHLISRLHNTGKCPHSGKGSAQGRMTALALS